MCPGKGGAKRSVGAYASDFYAGPVMPLGARRGPKCRVADEEDATAGSTDRWGGAVYPAAEVQDGKTP